MSAKNFFTGLWLFVALFSGAAAGDFRTAAYAQEPKAAPSPPPPPTPAPVENAGDEDVVRVSADLIQTGVTVFDKRGKFVDGLKLEDFELRVDGNPVPVRFFEPVNPRAGSRKNAPGNTAGAVAGNGVPSPPQPGRTVIFVVDDVHLSMDSHKRTRDMIREFIDRRMTPEDTAAVVSTTGKIGFLQQFTSDPTVLHAAVERLVYNGDRSAADRFNPPMKEYEAQLVDRGDREVTDIFANLMIQENPGLDLESARIQVGERARRVLSQAALINKQTYQTLEQAVRRSGQIAGRKIVFFISDGFLLDAANTDSSDRMSRITDAAARSNAVVYSVDPKGLEAGFPEGTAALYRVQSGERDELLDGPANIADATGGRLIRNTNDLKAGMTDVLGEASVYYLLAWQPGEQSGGGKSEKLRRIEISIKNQPELKVRVQSGYLEENSSPAGAGGGGGVPPSPSVVAAAKTPASAAEDQLAGALNAQVPRRSLPTSLVANYLDLPAEGATLTASLRVDGNALEFTREADRAKARVDLVGVVYNAEGKREAYFREVLTVDSPAGELGGKERPAVNFNYRTKLKPGLYQVRVAARDLKSGRAGSAFEWVEVQDLSSRKLALSSLLVGELTSEPRHQKQSATPADAALGGGIEVSVDRRFSRDSELLYLVFIYNAGGSSPDLTIQTEVLRGAGVVMTSPARPVSAAGQDPARIPYAAQIALKTLPAGSYELRVTVSDRAAKKSVTRRVRFKIE